MQHYRRILVGVDLSAAQGPAASDLGAPTLEAINRGLWLAESTSAELTFFSALEMPTFPEGVLQHDTESLTASVEAAAQEVHSELIEQGKGRGVVADSHFVFGEDWIEITRHVLRGGHDMVIVGTRDRSDEQRPLIGSTGMKLLRYCPSAVWVIPPEPLPEVPNVLVASDLSETAADSLHVVVSAGQLIDTKTRIVHVAQFPLERAPWRASFEDDELAKYREHVRTAAENELHEQLSFTDWRTLTFGVLVDVLEGPVDPTILKAIEEYEIDWLVMGTVDRCDVPGRWMGGHAERLLPQVPCSVLAFKPTDFQSPITLD